MSDTVVIGIGNTLRSDDGAGVHAAEIVRRVFPAIDVFTVHELKPELAESLLHYRQVIFMDAAPGGSEVTCTEVVPDAGNLPAGSHSCSPAGLLAMCRTLFGHTPERAFLLSIPAHSFDFGETLSPFTAEKVTDGVALVGNLECVAVVEGSGTRR